MLCGLIEMMGLSAGQSSAFILTIFVKLENYYSH
jgi:hypothetical protein